MSVTNPTRLSGRTVAIHTLGCKVNQAESDDMAQQFAEAGLGLRDFDQPADVYVVNTCTVTHTGDAKSRQVLRQAKRRNPNALVVATGCYASIVRDQLPVDDVLVVRNRDKEKLVGIVLNHFQSVDNSSLVDPEGLGGRISPRSRANLKVQDGCDNACAYCIIPRARGRSRSVTPDDCVSRSNQLADAGHSEIVITGVDLGSYGDNETGFPDLGGLLERLLNESRVHRLRVSSLEPGDFKVGWLDLWRDSRLCRHLHVPLQAGSDAILRAMRRKYNREVFSSMLETCRSVVPNMTITTDVITGFPGESDADFEDGLNFIKACQFDGIHVFPYSRRSGTAAAALGDSVSESVKKERAAVLRQEADAGRCRLVERNKGLTGEVVWESEHEGVWRGTTDNNVRVFSSDSHLRPNLVERRVLAGAFADGCWGEQVSAAREISLIAV